VTLAEIRAEIERLPAPGGDYASATPASTAASPEASPLSVVSKQGRLILRLSASAETLEGRVRDLARQVEGQNAGADALRTEKRQAETRARQMALEAVHLMDVLDRTREALTARGDETMAAEMATALRDGARRLAAVGVTEIPCAGLLDGRLHEGEDTVPAPHDTPRYHIVSVVRRGWQCGADVLRRASVITAD
jgi:molecular chaperone GrpE (heat shock protein)